MITCFCVLILLIGYSHEQITPDVSISIEVPPKEFLKQFPNGTVNMYVKKGSNMVLECTVFNMPSLGNIFWKKYPYKGDPTPAVAINKGLTSYDLSKYKIGQGKQPYSIRLEILTVEETYAGIYACEVMYSANVVNAKAERTLMIYDMPVITYTEFKNKVDTGKDITLSCIANGIPAPSVLWRRIGGNSNIIKNTGIVLYNNKVTLTQVTYKDAGMYACYAENEWGSEERKFALSVTHAPVITITPNGNNAYQMLGCMVQLTCAVKADPVPPASEIKWTSSKQQTIKNGGRFTIKTLASTDQETFCILRIYPTQIEDLADVTYSCSATNSMGTGSSSVTFKASQFPNPLITGPFRCGALMSNLSSCASLISLLFVICNWKLQLL